MSTGTIDNWHGNMTEIGPLYPFVGFEGLLVVIAVAFWIVWTVWQWRMESSNYNDDMRTLKQNDNMTKALKGEKVLRSM